MQHGMLVGMDDGGNRYDGGPTQPAVGMASALAAAITVHYALTFEAIDQLSGGDHSRYLQPRLARYAASCRSNS